jgi:predicted DNA-binding transcriptional regulator AlpA
MGNCRQKRRPPRPRPTDDDKRRAELTPFNDLELITGVYRSRAAVMRDKSFPERVKYGGRYYWVTKEVEAWKKKQFDNRADETV